MTSEMRLARRNFLRQQRGDVGRVLGRDVLDDVIRQRDECLGLRRRGCLAAHFQNRADLLGVVDEDADAPFGGFTGSELRRRVGELLAKQIDRLVHVAADFGQGGFAVHHRQIGAIAERFDVGG